MSDPQMLFPMEPKEFWQKLKIIVEQVVIEHSNHPPLNSQTIKKEMLLKGSDVCKIFRVSKPTLYEWMNTGKLPSVKIGARRFFKQDDIDSLIERNRITQGLN